MYKICGCYIYSVMAADSIRASVDALYRDGKGQISRDLPTKSFLTWRKHLASP